MKKKILIITFLFLSIFLFSPIKLEAATAYIKATPSKSTVLVGNKINVTVRISSSVPIGSWYYNLSYNSSYLRLNSGDVTVVDSATNSSTYSKTYTYTFTALKSGNVSVSTKNASVLSFSESYMTPSISSASFNIMTLEQLEATYSSNNYLSELKVQEGALSPAFNKDTTKYTIELEPETEKINVSAKTIDSKADIKGTGEISVTEGLNVINVVVTAENGKTKTYRIEATVKELKPIEVTIDKKVYTIVRKDNLYTPPIDFDKTTIKMEEEDVLAYQNEKIGVIVGLKSEDNEIDLYLYDSIKNDYKKYIAISFKNSNLYLSDNHSQIPVGYKKTELELGDNLIKAWTYNKNKNFFLIYGINTENGEEGFYQYDKKNNTVQRFFDNQIKDLIKNDNFDKLVIYILGAVVGVLIIKDIVILITKIFKKKDVVEDVDLTRSNKKKNK